MKVRLREIDLLRGIAIILVIIGHSFILHPVNIHDVPWCLSTFNWIYTFHMELFFLLAGCVFHCVNYKQFIKKKVDRILIPYFLFGMVSLVLAASSIGAVNRHMSWTDGLNKLLFHGGEYWFLYVLFLIFAIYPLIDNFCKNDVYKGLLVLVLLVVNNFVHLSSFLLLYVVVYQLPYFIIGTMLAGKLGKLREVKMLPATIVSFCCIALFVVSTPKIQIGGGILLSIRHLRAFMMIIPAYSLSIGLIKMAETSAWCEKFCHFLEECSKYSLQLYLFNGFFLVIIRVLLCNVMHISNPFIILLGITTGNIVVSLVLCKYIIPRNKLISYLCGISSK